MLLTGYDIDKRKFYLLNLMINFAEYVIYRNHVKRLNSKKKIHAKGLLKYQFKSDLTFYLNCKKRSSY